MHIKNTSKDCDKRDNNNNKKKKNNGNFVCVFECTIVNLARYWQFANAA